MMSTGQTYHNASTTASNLLDYDSEKSNYFKSFIYIISRSLINLVGVGYM